MKDAIERAWREFKEESPGHRFEGRYERRHASGRGGWKRALSLGAGIVVFLVGLVMMPAPGPGVLVAAFGAGLVAQESRWSARALDRFEVWVRRVFGPLAERWRHAPTWVQLGSLAIAGACGLALAYGSYRLFTR